MSEGWSNRHELTLAKDFVEHLDGLADGETGRLLFEVDGTDAASKTLATEFAKALQGKVVLGLLTAEGIPARPAGPAFACRIRFNASDASVQLTGSDASARKWDPFGKFTLPLVQENGKLDHVKFADSLAEAVLNRLVRAQVIKGSAQKHKDKLIYQIRIENASPLILNGLALVGTASKEGELPKLLSGIAISPRRACSFQPPRRASRGWS